MFCAVVVALVVINHLQTTRADVLNLSGLKDLRLQLKASPGNGELREQIRTLDLLARQTFFASTSFARTGGWLLLAGAGVLVASLRLMAWGRPPLPDPGKFTGLLDLAAKQRGARVGVAVLGAALALWSLYLGKPPAAALDSGLAEPSPAVPGPVTRSALETVEAARQWPAFRGPGGGGIAAPGAAPVEWDGAAGKGVLWKTAVPLPGFSSPIVWGGDVFLTGGTRDEREVYCFNAASGALRWKHAVAGISGSPAEPPKVASDTGYAASTMTTDGRLVFAIFATGDLVALDWEGKRIWAKALGTPENPYGHSSSLLVHEGRLFVQFDHSAAASVAALDPATGRELWRAPRSSISWSSPILVNTGARQELILTDSTGVDSYEPATGRRLWEQRCMDAEVGTSAAYEGGMVFAGNDGTLGCAILIAGSNGAAQVAWEYRDDLPEVASPLAVNGCVFLASAGGAVTCLDARSGKRQWRQAFDDGFWASPVAAGTNVYALDRAGLMRVFAAAPEYRPVAASPLGEATVCTPAIAEGRLYIRGVQNLYCIGAPGG
jgi:outer membrane protein assembly factor BamB